MLSQALIDKANIEQCNLRAHFKIKPLLKLVNVVFYTVKIFVFC